ncbi:DUF2254 domain-containing protein [Marinobacter subterrani]|uniref:Putative membrane protein n=1 Tax=Marinobacter subterrani TaxID=1658765 RepID=A0A0J7J9P3_9GAMM|nr:DUF2254 domain-containing protein [Marinobacter subterrani]KMQ74694.1 putative membrane protein [Marinobacter subterrani]
MDSKFFWIIRQHLRKIWVRVISFALLAVLTLALTPVLSPLIPTHLGASLGSVSVDQILTILASSMLAVTTFSLSIAVSAFAAAAANATPRATAILQQDPTTQNVLSTFLGAFLFSLIGLIGLRTDFYDQQGQVFLFMATLVVVSLVVIALLRWIGHISNFGRMHDILSRVERAATISFRHQLENPYLRARPLSGSVPDDAYPIAPTRTGYVQHIDIKALNECARNQQIDIYIDALPGTFVHAAARLVRIRGANVSAKQQQFLRDAFTIETKRSFDQDPRFALIVLSEIASRALSPAVNDPGTAISVIGHLVRVLSTWKEPQEPPVDFPSVHVPAVLPSDMIIDAFRPIARDGAAFIEVQVRLQKALASLGRIAPEIFGRPVAELSAYAIDRAADAGMCREELKSLETLRVPSRAGSNAGQNDDTWETL